MKEAICDGLSPTNEDMIDDFLVDDEENIEEEDYEVTVIEIDDLRNECMRETEEYINRRLLQNHEVLNKVCSRKRRVLCEPFSSHLETFLAMMDISVKIARCTILVSLSYCRK